MNNDNLLDSALYTGKKVLRKAGDAAVNLAEEARIRFKIAELNNLLARKYRRLGRLACNAMDEGNLTMGEEMQRVYNDINALKEDIASLKEEL